MTLGAAHLSHLFARYNQSRILTYVAYNAGPNRAVQWIERFGDPRSAGIDPVDWVELIPFQETRNYVQRVLENSQVYRARLNDAPIAGKLAGDIELGGAPKRAGLVPNRLFAGTLPPLPERTARFADAADLVDLDPPSPGPEPAPAETTPASGDLETGLPGSALDEADSADYLGDGPRLASTKPKGRLAVERAAEARANPTPTANQIPAPPRLAPSAATSPASPATNPPAMAPIRALEDKPPSTLRSVNALSSDASCQTYRDYIATTARENASAADLNSGMLAEARSGARACEEDPGGAPAPSPRN